MNEEEQLVYDYLSEYAVGKQNSKTSDEIVAVLGEELSGRTNEPIRNIMRKLILDYGALIGSNRNGFWIIQTEEELSEVISGLEHRSDEINNRIDALNDNWGNQ